MVLTMFTSIVVVFWYNNISHFFAYFALIKYFYKQCQFVLITCYYYTLQVKSDFGSDEDYTTSTHPTVARVAPTGRSSSRGRPGSGDYHGDSGSQIDSKSTNSYHISELEASESVQVRMVFIICQINSRVIITALGGCEFESWPYFSNDVVNLLDNLWQYIKIRWRTGRPVSVLCGRGSWYNHIGGKGCKIDSQSI